MNAVHLLLNTWILSVNASICVSHNTEFFFNSRTLKNTQACSWALVIQGLMLVLNANKSLAKNLNTYDSYQQISESSASSVP